MSELDRASLDRTLPPRSGSADWDEVLRGAGAGAGRERRGRRGLIALAAEVLVVVVGTASAFGTVRDLFSGPHVQTTFFSSEGKRGSFSLRILRIDGPRSWRMQFDVRSATQTDMAAHAGSGELQGFIDEGSWQAARREIEVTFGPQATEKPDGIVKRLAATLGMNKQDWPMSLLRRIAESLSENEAGRRRSAAR